MQGEAQSTQHDVATALNALDGSASKSDPGVASALAALGRANGSMSAINSGLTSASQNAATSALIASAVNAQIDKLSPGLTAAASGAATSFRCGPFI